MKKLLSFFKKIMGIKRASPPVLPEFVSKAAEGEDPPPPEYPDEGNKGDRRRRSNNILTLNFPFDFDHIVREHMRWLLSNGIEGEQAVLINKDLRAAGAKNICLDRAILDGSDFSENDLSGSTFKGANLCDVKFTSSKLIQTDFTDAKLERAHFEEAEVHQTTFTGAIVEEAHFERAKLENAIFDNGSCRIGTGGPIS